jgi:hypothetical protein
MASRSSFERPSDQEAVHENGAVPLADNSNQAQTESTPNQNSPLIESEKKHSNQNPTHARIGTSRLGFLKPWRVELIACVVVLLAIMAIVLTLAIHQNQPLPNWPFGISVNSLVSVFVVILKGGMLLILNEGSSPPSKYYRSYRSTSPNLAVKVSVKLNGRGFGIRDLFTTSAHSTKEAKGH